MTKEDLKMIRKIGLDRKECESILNTSKKSSWAYRIAKESLEEMDRGRI
ncbi:MAG: hypothetical protein KKD44_28555 [Proteobacteria bacterium]|nr:hypothetical protein [Pseudomonadota bacterium]